MPSPKDTHGPVVKTGPTRGENRTRDDEAHGERNVAIRAFLVSRKIINSFLIEVIRPQDISCLGAVCLLTYMIQTICSQILSFRKYSIHFVLIQPQSRCYQNMGTFSVHPAPDRQFLMTQRLRFTLFAK